MDVDQRVAYTLSILRGAALNKNKAVLLECKQSAEDLTGDKWTLGEPKGTSTDEFWTWLKSDGVGYDMDSYLGLDKCVDFEKDIWFALGKLMWRKHRSVFQDHLKYIHNDIVKPFRFGMIHYAKRVEEMHYLENHLTPTLMKGYIF